MGERDTAAGNWLPQRRNETGPGTVPGPSKLGRRLLEQPRPAAIPSWKGIAMDKLPRTPRPRQPRSARLVVPITADSQMAVVVITDRGRSDRYHVRPLPSASGTAYAVEKV